MRHVVLRTAGLTKRYGSLTAVKDLTLDVYEGEVFGLLGPNGAGKTTSINMMCGLLKPDAGQVWVHDVPITGGETKARARVGMCPQEIVLWKRLTCIEQLQFIGQMYGMPAKDAYRQGERLLQALYLLGKKDQRAETLSGGMQRRLNLAMALVHDPGIIVLDEPEAGLDPQSRIRVREFIQSLARQRTVILTTHNMDEAERVADRVAIIDHGTLLTVDTPEALKHSVGEGDVLEIHLDEAAEDSRQAQAALSSLAASVDVHVAGGVLAIRTLNAVGLLPTILEKLGAAGVRCGEVRLRENTLEDVFIQLTGRSLRE